MVECDASAYFAIDCSKMILSRDLKGISLVDAEIAHSVLDVLVPEKELRGAQIAGFPVDISRLGASKRVGRVVRRIKPRTRNPFLHETPELLNADRTILAACKAGKEPRRAYFVRGDDPALEGEPCAL